MFKTIAILRSLELLYTKSTLRVSLPDVQLKAVFDHSSSSSKLDYYEYLNQCRRKMNIGFGVSVETNVGEGMLFRMSSGKYQSSLKTLNISLFLNFTNSSTFHLLIHLLSNFPGYLMVQGYIYVE